MKRTTFADQKAYIIKAISNENWKLMEKLIADCSLEVLDLKNQKIDVEGAKYLAAGLMKNATLTKLGLKGNNIGNVGARYLANSLVHNKTLTSLDLRENHISKAGAKVINAALGVNTAVTSINLENNFITPYAFEAVHNRLCENLCRKHPGNLALLPLVEAIENDAVFPLIAHAFATNHPLSFGVKTLVIHHYTILGTYENNVASILNDGFLLLSAHNLNALEEIAKIPPTHSSPQGYKPNELVSTGMEQLVPLLACVEKAISYATGVEVEQRIAQHDAGRQFDWKERIKTGNGIAQSIILPW